jgi:hypothetical protein
MATITVDTRRGPISVETALTTREAYEILRDDRNEFSHSLCEAFTRNRLSAKQANWLLLKAQEIVDRNRPRPTITLGQMANVAAMFARAGQNLKWPKIRLLTSDGRTIVLRRKRDGSIAVTDDGDYDDRAYFGRISAEGEFDSRRPDPEVLDVLLRFTADPVAVALEYSRLAGHCCFCRLPLTDERSTHAGYGPVCADNYGLPWGDRPVVELAKASA